MAPGFLHRISDDPDIEKHIEKQIGCMAGFLQMFDRHQILAGKRLYSSKRLAPASTKTTETKAESIGDSLTDRGSDVATPSPAGNSDSPAFTPARSVPVVRREQQLQQQPRSSLDIRDVVRDSFSKEPTVNNMATKTPHRPEIRTPLPGIQVPATLALPLPLSMFEFKDAFRSSLKLREAPRLSLDSRAVVDQKGSLYPREIRTSFVVANRNGRSSLESLEENEDGEKQRRSPSVVARLMGLEALPDSVHDKKISPELRRSASESRANRDLLPYKFVDGSGFQFNSGSNSSNAELPTKKNTFEEERSKRLSKFDVKTKSEMKRSSNGGGLGWNLQQQKKSFDSQDFFPEQKRTGMIYGEIERRLKMRGIDEPAKDLETLKQILEALQLKGLLHSRKSEERSDNRNFVYDRFSMEESPDSSIVVMRPTSYLNKRSPISGNRRIGDEPNSRFSGGNCRGHVTREPVRRNLATEFLPPVRPRRDRPECDRKEGRIRNSPTMPESGAKSPSSLNRRRSPVNLEMQRKGKDPGERRYISDQSPKSVLPKKVGSDLASKSPRNKKQTIESSHKERNSSPIELERSPKLENEGRNLLDRCDKLLHSIAEVMEQPSPVSVLDSSFYKDDTPPSYVMNRSFKDEPNWSAGVSPIQTKPEWNSSGLIREEEADDDDFVYVSEILQNSGLKNQRKVGSLHRKLLFDAVTEILQKKNQQSFSNGRVFAGKQMLNEVWTEFRRLRDPIPATGDTFDVVCGVLRKDIEMGSDGWKEQSVEIPETVLDIERLIFKDLVAETIRELAVVAGKWRPPRRQLIFE